MKVLFLDESGDHSLGVIDPSYPIFVLGGVIADLDYAEGAMTQEIQTFKKSLFGREDLILHTADITRNKNGFERLKEPEFRSRFYAGINDLMQRLDYQVVACVIQKDSHLARYGIAALDPYMLSFDILVERFCYEIGHQVGGGTIIAEKRNITLDSQLELAWLNLKIQGTRHVRAKEIARRVQGLALRDKRENVAGLQLADLVVSPIGRFVANKPTKEDFRIIESKMRRAGRDDYRGPGLVVLPTPT